MDLLRAAWRQVVQFTTTTTPTTPTTPTNPKTTDPLDETPDRDRRRPYLIAVVGNILPTEVIRTIIEPYADDWTHTWNRPSTDQPVSIVGNRADCWFLDFNGKAEPFRRIVAAQPIPKSEPYRWRIRADFTAGRSGFMAVGMSTTNVNYARPSVDKAGATLISANDRFVWTSCSSVKDDRKTDVFADNGWTFNGTFPAWNAKQQQASTIILLQYEPSNRRMTVDFRDGDNVVRSISVVLPTDWSDLFPAVAVCGVVSATILSWPDDAC